PLTLTSSRTHRAPSPPYPLSLHDALPIWPSQPVAAARLGSPRPKSTAGLPPSAGYRTAHRTGWWPVRPPPPPGSPRTRASRHPRSEEHTSELQSRENLVCRLLLEKKKQIT